LLTELDVEALKLSQASDGFGLAPSLVGIDSDATGIHGAQLMEQLDVAVESNLDFEYGMVAQSLRFGDRARAFGDCKRHRSLGEGPAGETQELRHRDAGTASGEVVQGDIECAASGPGMQQPGGSLEIEGTVEGLEIEALELGHDLFRRALGAAFADTGATGVRDLDEHVSSHVPGVASDRERLH
jgi:hypothetical protein